ncbi:hypothetical protein MEO93_28510, partial [Dolichospermum sp. ST_sed3]|nr:hypothetical protein [Dolichospermum sp. ST_sed3]
CVLGVFLYKNRVLCFIKPKIRSFQTSNYLSKLPLDGILVEGLICQPIAYWTNKRVVVLSHDPVEEYATYQTNLAIYHFKLNYAVISDRWKKDLPGEYPAILEIP